MDAQLLPISLVLALACAVPAIAEDTPANPVELGAVTWSRDLETSLTQSKRTGKPVLILFQEIPGCQGCRDFGTGPLSHPLMVEAMEELFVPVAINNRGGGSDEVVLAKYEEPKLNYPVARFVDAHGEDLIPRKDQVFSIDGVADRMIAALERVSQPVPGYLRLVAAEHRETERATATFAMHCYWVGEAKLGHLDGVLETRSAWQGRHEVVDVTFDPTIISYDDLLRKARSLDCASHVYARDAAQAEAARAVMSSEYVHEAGESRIAKASDQKYALLQTTLRFVPMTSLQATRVNALLAAEKPVKGVLSTRQLTLHKAIEKALVKDPQLLGGLETPTAVGDWATYLEKVHERINPTG